jgi:hypothetical protein
MTTNRWTARLIASLVVAATGCADPLPVAPPQGNRTMIFINLSRDQETLFITGDAASDSVPYGSAKLLVDTRGSGFGPPPNGVLFRPRNGPMGPGIPFLAARTTVIVHGASVLPRVSPLADTLGARSDVVNIRIALLAPDAPLVRAYVLQAAQPLAGSLNRCVPESVEIRVAPQGETLTRRLGSWS